VPTYVAERYLPGGTWEQVLDAARRVKRSTAELAAAGTPVRYLRSTFLPGDEACCCLFQAPSEDAVRQVNDRAQVPFDRIVEVVHVAAEDLADGSEDGPRAHDNKEQP
jgi:hypothetical protein